MGRGVPPPLVVATTLDAESVDRHQIISTRVALSGRVDLVELDLEIGAACWAERAAVMSLPVQRFGAQAVESVEVDLLQLESVVRFDRVARL